MIVEKKKTSFKKVLASIGILALALSLGVAALTGCGDDKPTKPGGKTTKVK